MEVRPQGSLAPVALLRLLVLQLLLGVPLGLVPPRVLRAVEKRRIIAPSAVRPRNARSSAAPSAALRPACTSMEHRPAYIAATTDGRTVHAERADRETHKTLAESFACQIVRSSGGETSAT